MKTFNVELPDGRILEGVPEGTTKAQIAAKLGISLGTKPVEPTPQQQAGENLDAYKAGLVGAASGVTSGLNDELMAGMAAAGSVPVTGVIEVANRFGANIPNPLAGKGLGNAIEQVYNKELKQNRAQDKAATEGHPYATAAGNITGAIINPINKVLPTSGGVVNTAVQGGALGAAQGFGEGEGGAGDRLVNAMTTGATGAAIGGAVGAAGNLLKYAGKKINPAPTVAKLKDISDKAFTYIKKSNFGFEPKETTAISESLRKTLPEDPHSLLQLESDFPEIGKTISHFEKNFSGGRVSLDGMRSFDKSLNDKITKSIVNGKATSETNQLYKMQNALREKMDEAAERSVPAVRDAYYVFSQQRKIEDIGNLLERSLNTQNPATSLKTNAANYLRKARGLDDKEKELLQKVVDEDLGDELLRTLGARLAGIGQVAQGNFGQAMGQVALSKLSRNTLEARKLAKIDDLTNYIARNAEARINAMGYLDEVAPALPKYPSLKDQISPDVNLPKTGVRGGYQGQGIRQPVNPPTAESRLMDYKGAKDTPLKITIRPKGELGLKPNKSSKQKLAEALRNNQ
jgi:hypothetical protein